MFKQFSQKLPFSQHFKMSMTRLRKGVVLYFWVNQNLLQWLNPFMVQISRTSNDDIAGNGRP